MFDIGWTELLVIAVVLIVVVGPKDLPPMLRAFGKTMTRFRKVAGEFRAQFDEALREADLDEVRQHIADAQRLNPANSLREAMSPLRQMGSEIKADLQRSTIVDHSHTPDASMPPAAPALQAPTESPMPVIAPPVAAVSDEAPVKLKAPRKPRAKAAEKAVEEPSVVEPSQVGVLPAVDPKPKRAPRKASVKAVAVEEVTAAPAKTVQTRRRKTEKEAVALLVEPAQVEISEVVAKPKRAPRKTAVAVAEDVPPVPAKVTAPRKSAKKKDDA